MQKVEGGLPPQLVRKMRKRIFIDGALGLIPVLGDLADMVYRCNTMNVRTFEKYLLKKHGPKGMNKQQLNNARLEEIPDTHEVYVGEKRRREDDDDGHAMSQAKRARPPPARPVRGWRNVFGARQDPERDIEMGQAPRQPAV